MLAATGELDIATAPALEERALAALGRGPVVLDLSGLDFIDSTGVKMLLDMREAARREDGRWWLVCSAPVTRVIELADLQDTLPISESADAAVSASGD